MADYIQAIQAIQKASRALRRGDRCSARRWAGQAAALNPDLEDAWLILAALASPRASAAYLDHALQLHPTSQRVRAGLVWAQARMQLMDEAAPYPPDWLYLTEPGPQAGGERLTPRRMALLSALVVLLVVITLASPLASPRPPGNQFAMLSIRVITDTPQAAALIPATRTQLPIPTRTSTPTTTPTASPTITPSPSPTEPPTDTPSPSLTPTETSPPPTPTNAVYVVKSGDTLTQIAAAFNLSVQDLMAVNDLPDPALLRVSQTLVIPPPGLVVPTVTPAGPKHILVNLTEQRLYAMQGDQVVYSFRATTGRNDSTPPGDFSILNKNPNAYSDPWGFWMPYWMGIDYTGPNLQNGIHGLPLLPNGSQLWGDALGMTPVSYGCVVLDTPDARTLYSWAGLYTPVEIVR